MLSQNIQAHGCEVQAHRGILLPGGVVGPNPAQQFVPLALGAEFLGLLFADAPSGLRRGTGFGSFSSELCLRSF